MSRTMDILLSFVLLVVGGPLANEVAGNGLHWHDKVSERIKPSLFLLVPVLSARRGSMVLLERASWLGIFNFFLCFRSPCPG